MAFTQEQIDFMEGCVVSEPDDLILMDKAITDMTETRDAFILEDTTYLDIMKDSRQEIEDKVTSKIPSLETPVSEQEIADADPFVYVLLEGDPKPGTLTVNGLSSGFTIDGDEVTVSPATIGLSYTFEYTPVLNFVAGTEFPSDIPELVDMGSVSGFPVHEEYWPDPTDWSLQTSNGTIKYSHTTGWDSDADILKHENRCALFNEWRESLIFGTRAKTNGVAYAVKEKNRHRAALIERNDEFEDIT